MTRRKKYISTSRMHLVVEETLYNAMLGILGEEDLSMTDYIQLLMTKDIAERLEKWVLGQKKNINNTRATKT